MSCRYVLFRKAEEEDRETFIVFCCGSRRERKDQMDRNGAEFAFALRVEEKEESMFGALEVRLGNMTYTVRTCTKNIYSKLKVNCLNTCFSGNFPRD